MVERVATLAEAETIALDLQSLYIVEIEDGAGRIVSRIAPIDDSGFDVERRSLTDAQLDEAVAVDALDAGTIYTSIDSDGVVWYVRKSKRNGFYCSETPVEAAEAMRGDVVAAKRKR
jgi:hypothetical protein